MTLQHDDADPRPAYEAFLQRLAARPVLVTVSSFILTALVTGVVLAVEPDSVDIMGVVSLTATIWGVTLALVIYLLTAQDTSRVLGQIGDLQEQLSAALAEPDATDEETETLPDAVASPHVEPPSELALRPTGKPEDRRQRTNSGPWGNRETMFYAAGTGVALQDRVPAEYVEAWQAATRRRPEEVIRAWTRGHPDRSPWLLLCDDGTRWSVYASPDGAPSVIQLSEPRGGRQQRPGRDGRQPSGRDRR